MATTGRELRGLAAASIVVAALVMVSAAARGSGRASAAQPRRHWCEARTNASWRRVLGQHVVPLSRTTSLDPWTLAHDGRSFFATVYSPSFSGVARISATTRGLTRIKAFPDSTDYQADGAFDGRWLVWHEYHGFTSFDEFTTWAWDSRTGNLNQIGAATRAPNGAFWESPWRGPDVRSGTATWVQGSGADGRTEVHVYDLRKAHDKVVRRGHAQGSFLLAGHLVAWPESPAPDAETEMYAANTLTGSRIPAPRALRRLRGVSGLVTDGRRIAYPSASYRSLWWSPSLHAEPREIVATRGLNYVDNSVQIGGHYIDFGIQPRVLVGDRKTRRYVTLTHHGGWTRVDSKSLLVVFATGSKQLDAVAPVAFVPVRDLPPIPSCR